MKRRDIFSLFGLSALWGASYLFMRIGAGEFGALTMAGARAAGATLLLLPLLALGQKGGMHALRHNWKSIALIGITNSALPFVLFGVAALSINASMSAIFNAATPLYAAVIGLLWFQEGIDTKRGIGLACGFAGVLWLAWDNASLKDGTNNLATSISIAACMAATVLYAFSAHYTKRYLADVPPLAVATGSQLVSTIVLAVPALIWRPTVMPSAHAWLSLIALAVICTAFAYVLFFRLIAAIGASSTMTVPFLVPAFGVLWGLLFLHEVFTLRMAAGSSLIIMGTALTTGLIRYKSPISTV